ncbi:hypothetical protein [Nonomuraea dietziae]|uniref:hypothetical protein n=1 Tax=Nonomuraea dietziae TaxID=65515 RepID=UPI00344525CE
MTVIIPTKQNTPTEARRAEYVKGLRALADILEAHPEVPLPYDGSSPDYGRITFSDFLHSKDPRADMAATRRALGVPVAKSAREDYFDLHGNLHGLYFTLTAFRSDVCERVVVDRQEIDVEVPDPEALALVPKVKRTEVVEQVEWRCSPLLTGSAA